MSDRWGPDGPPTEAYERVTDPERFRPLQEVVRQRLAVLVVEYDAELSADPGGVVHVTPAGGGAPISVQFTDFPGVEVRLGRTTARALPACGCDACDEQVDELVQELDRLLVSTVTGGLTEAVDRRHLTQELASRGVHERRVTPVRHLAGDRPPRGWRSDWRPWVRR